MYDNFKTNSNPGFYGKYERKPDTADIKRHNHQSNTCTTKIYYTSVEKKRIFTIISFLIGLLVLPLFVLQNWHSLWLMPERCLCWCYASRSRSSL